MKYLFILGRNIELSIAEVKAFFEREQNRILNYSLKNNGALVEVESPLKKGVVEKFGGVIAIGEVICSGKDNEIINEINKKEIYLGEKNNFNYVVWSFSENTNKIEEYLKKRFRNERLKAVQKKIGGEIILQSGEKVNNLQSRRLIDEEYFLFEVNGREHFGRIVERSNYEEIEKRDMEKPIRREELSISPRLAKIMINLSQARQNEKLVDCFCGVGVILQEALIQNIKVVGIDKDEKAIDGAKKNLEWANFLKENYKLINFDSRKVKIENANVIVSEPDLGEVLKKIPAEKKARGIIENYEKLIIGALNNLKRNISGRIVFTAPFINILKKKVSCNAEKILNETGLRLVEGFPILESRKEQIVGREIFVLEH